MRRLDCFTSFFRSEVEEELKEHRLRRPRDDAAVARGEAQVGAFPKPHAVGEHVPLEVSGGQSDGRRAC